jgi:hypothetical protein
MTQPNENEFYDRVVRRLSRMIPALGLIGAISVAVLQGIPSGFAFLIGAAVSFASFWGWRHLVDAFGPNPKKRNPAFFVFWRLAPGL